MKDNKKVTGSLAVVDRCISALEAFSTKVVLRGGLFVYECSDGGLRKARADFADSLSVLEKWVGDGALQSFQDRERFRSEARAIIDRCRGTP